MDARNSIGYAHALWQQLQWVAGVLGEMDDGRGIANGMGRVPVAVRPGVQAIAYAVVRRYGLGQKLVTLLVQRKPSAPTYRYLTMGLALLAQPREQDAPTAVVQYEPHTLVNQLVEAVRRTPKISSQAHFVNGVLRQFLRDAPQLLEQALQDSRAQWNHPSWWLDRLKKDHPHEWKSILQLSQSKADLTLRVNRRRTSVGRYLTLLKEKGVQAHQVGASAVRLARAVNVAHIPGFAEGWVSVQDAGAQMAAELVHRYLPTSAAGVQPRVLDACAAPGGKTAHLLELFDCDVVALEIDPARIGRINENVQRLGLTATVICADAAQLEQWRPLARHEQPFDAILLDAPCSASGIVRRHPDIPWQRRASDIEQLVVEQRKLLQCLWSQLRCGGIMVYCTCSVFHAEGVQQIEHFIQRHNDAALLTPLLQLLPKKDESADWQEGKLPLDHDGFFYAVLQKANG